MVKKEETKKDRLGLIGGDEGPYDCFIHRRLFHVWSNDRKGRRRVYCQPPGAHQNH